MMRVLRTLLIALGLTVVAAVVWQVSGLNDEVDGSYAFDPAAVPGDLDSYLAASEAVVANLRPGAEKRIVWAGEAGAQTDWAVVYLHGFSATSEEIRPVPDRVAEALGANLYFARLAGHGRDGAAMAEPTGADWLADTAEALEIGRRLGKRVLVIGTSTGGTLATVAAADPAMAKGLAGVVLISPNYAISNPMAFLLTWPGVRLWGPVVAGETRSFEPRSPAQAQHWTTSYPTLATVAMAHLVRYVDGLALGDVETPALFLFSDQDQVVRPEATRAVADRWGGPVQIEVVTPGPGDDAYAHVIAGEIMSPGMTDPVVERIVAWAAGL